MSTSYGGAFIFDAESEAALRGVWQEVARVGGSNFLLGLDYPPHLTIFLSGQWDLPGLKAGFVELAAQTRPVEVSLPSLGIFPGDLGVIFQAPIATPALLDLHARFFAVAEQNGAHISGHYRPGVWVPHITVGYGLPPDALGAALSALMAFKLPQTARISGLIFGMFNLDGPSQLERIWFGKNE